VNHLDASEDSEPAVIALHAINGIGTGHLARQTALAEYLRVYHRRLAPVVLSSGSAVKDICGTAPALILPQRWSPIPERSSNPLWTVLDALADSLSAAALERLRPRVVVHDTTVQPSLMRAAAEIGAGQAFCLRPRRDLRSYLEDEECPLREMDLVFVPDLPSHYPEMTQILEEAGISALWTGPIFRTAAQDRATTRAELGIGLTTPFVVVMSGGGYGADSQNHLANCLAALALVEQPGINVAVILGPLFTSAFRMPASFPHSVTIMPRSNALPNFLYAADVVLCRGGYGSLHEATAGAAVVLATPATRTWDDQEARINNFAAAGACEWVQSTEATDFAAQITRALSRGRRSADAPRTTQLRDGLAQLGARLVKLAQHPQAR